MSWISLGIQPSSTSVPVCLVRLKENRAWAQHSPSSWPWCPSHGQTQAMNLSSWALVLNSWGSQHAHFYWIWTWKDKAQELLLSWGELVGEVGQQWASRAEKQKPGSLHTRGPLDKVLPTNKFISLHDLWQQPTFQFLGLASLVRGSIIRIKNLLIGTEMIWRLPVTKAKLWMYSQWKVANTFTL